MVYSETVCGTTTVEVPFLLTEEEEAGTVTTAVLLWLAEDEDGYCVTGETGALLVLLRVEVKTEVRVEVVM